MRSTAAPIPVPNFKAMLEIATELDKLNRSQDMLFEELRSLSVRIDAVLDVVRKTGDDAMTTFEARSMAKRLAELEQRVAHLEDK